MPYGLAVVFTARLGLPRLACSPRGRKDNVAYVITVSRITVVRRRNHVGNARKPYFRR
jgi:hypothetical protein